MIRFVHAADCRVAETDRAGDAIVAAKHNGVVRKVVAAVSRVAVVVSAGIVVVARLSGIYAAEEYAVLDAGLVRAGVVVRTVRMSRAPGDAITNRVPGRAGYGS